MSVYGYHGYLWVFTSLYGCSWVFLSIYECHGCLKRSMGIYGCLQVLMGIYACSWIFMGIYGFLGVCRYFLVSMGLWYLSISIWVHGCLDTCF